MATKILQDNLWPTITKLARQSKRKHVAVAYLGRGANKLLPLGKGDSLVIDMSQEAVKNGQTDPNEVEKYIKKGVNAYTCSNLHAKVYIFDRTLIVGSANVSQHSRYGLVEAGLLCQDSDVLTQTLGWIRSLQVEPITMGYVEFCKTLYNPLKTRYDTKRKRKYTTTPTHYSLWVLSVSPVDFSDREDRLCEAEREKASKKLKDARKFEVSSIRWTGKSHITEHIREGDLVVQIWNERGKTEVYPPSRVIHITKYQSFDRKKIPRILIHIEEPKHPRLLSWRQFKKKVVNAGLRRISRNSKREIRSLAIKHTILGLWS